MLIELSRRLAASGIAHIGHVSRARFDAEAPPGFRLCELAPRAESLLVAASAGRAFWANFERHVAAHPCWLSRANPLDDFTEVVVGEATRGIDDVVRVFYPFFSFEPRLPFQKLGVLAALGQPSPLGLLVHPIHGPWFALRAAIALASPEPSPERPPNPSVCDACDAKPCITACPAHAVAASGWDSARCVSQCLTSEPCASRCDARRACPVGRDFAYGEEEMRYHHTSGFLAHFRVVEDGARN